MRLTCEQIEELGVKPILGDYLVEEMRQPDGLIARHDTHHVAHDLLRLMMEAARNSCYCLANASRNPPTRTGSSWTNQSSASSDNEQPDFMFAIAILAAGKGTRLKSRHPKVLHEIGGKPLLAHVVAAASQVVAPQNIFAIIGHEADRVEAALRSTGINFVRQTEQRGTGHAMMQARSALQSFDHVLVLSGDVPLIRPETIERVRDFHLGGDAAMTMLTART